MQDIADNRVNAKLYSYVVQWLLALALLDWFQLG